MQSSHRWWDRLPYSAFYRFLHKSGICSKSERITGVKDVLKFGQFLKEVELFNRATKNKYKIYFNAFGRCFPSSTGDVHSYIFVEDKKFERALPSFFKMMREVNNGIEIGGVDYTTDFYNYYNNSLSYIYDSRLDRMTQGGNYSEEQFEQVRNEKQAYYETICNIVRKYMPEIEISDKIEEGIDFDDGYDGDNPDM